MLTNIQNPSLFLAGTLFVAMLSGVIDMVITRREQHRLGQDSSTPVSLIVLCASGAYSAFAWQTGFMTYMMHIVLISGVLIWPAVGLVRARRNRFAVIGLLARAGLYATAIGRMV